MDDDRSAYSLFAEILTSNRVGLAHIRLVGEVIVAEARLNELLIDRRTKPLPEDRRVLLIEQAIECEDRYKTAWEKVNVPGTPVDPKALDDLQNALRDGMKTFRALRAELEATLDQ